MGFRFSSDFRMWNSFGHLFSTAAWDVSCKPAQHALVAGSGFQWCHGCQACRSLVWAIRVLGIIGSGLGELEGHSGDGRDRVYVVQIQASRAIQIWFFLGFRSLGV